jgi:5,6,7,8-tetrahydromethanopterin hydro-lyase
MTDLTMLTGEATVLAAEGQATDAMPEIVIGLKSGPVGHAFASMLAQSVGHTCMFAVRDLNQLVKPATMMTSKVTIPSAEYVDLLGGVVQGAISDGVLDSVIEGVIPKEIVEDICIVATIWLDLRCAEDENLDKADLYRTNYEAMKLAIKRAFASEPTIDELIANRKSVKHYALDGVVEY